MSGICSFQGCGNSPNALCVCESPGVKLCTVHIGVHFSLPGNHSLSKLETHSSKLMNSLQKRNHNYNLIKKQVLEFNQAACQLVMSKTINLIQQIDYRQAECKSLMKEVHLNPDNYTENQFEGSLESFEFKEALKSLEVMIDSTIKLPESNQSSRVDSKQESSYSFKNIKEDLRPSPLESQHSYSFKNIKEDLRPSPINSQHSYSFKNIKEDLRPQQAKPTPPREPFCEKNHKLIWKVSSGTCGSCSAAFKAGHWHCGLCKTSECYNCGASKGFTPPKKEVVCLRNHSLTTIQNTKTGACQRCSARGPMAGECKSCNFFFCEACFNYFFNDVKVSCPSGHYLEVSTKLKEKNGYSASNSCLLCGKQGFCTGYECRKCNVDLCGICFLRLVSKNTILCPKQHPIQLNLDLRQKYLASSSVVCDLCQTNGIVIGGECASCNFDVCENCIKQMVPNTDTLNKKCSNGHLLVMKSLNGGECNSCRNSVSVYGWSCVECNTCLCHRCEDKLTEFQTRTQRKLCPNGHRFTWHESTRNKVFGCKDCGTSVRNLGYIGCECSYPFCIGCGFSKNK